MSAVGRPPKPTILKLLEGNPGKRPLNLADGVNPEVAVPSVPKHLSVTAVKEWKRITPELATLGLIARVDLAALAMYCQAYGRMVELELAMKRRIEARVADGADYYDAVAAVMEDSTPSGYRQQSVQAQLLRSLREEVNRYLALFGLSPSARARVTPSMNQPQLPGIDAPAAGAGWDRFRSA
jgi:P27 family predicted phage terminase small subunit